MTIKTHGRMFTDNSVGIAQLNVTDGADAQALVTDGSGTLRFETISVSDNAVTTAKILNNAVTGAKIAMGSDAAGDVLYHNGTDYIRLAKGTAGQVLTVNSGATAPEWAAAAGKVVKISQVRNTAHLTWSNNNGWAVADAFAWADGGVATSLAYTGIATTNRLQITAYATFIANATGYGAIGLFSTQTLLGTARKQNHAGGKGYGPSPIFTDIPVPSTSAVTYTLRFTGEGGTVYLNTDNGLNNPVGGESCGIIITEYTP